MEHTINACGHANSTVHENMQSLIEQSGSVRKYAKDEIIYLQGDTAQSFCYIKKGSVKVYMNSVDGNEKTLNTARHGEIIGEGAFFDKKPRWTALQGCAPLYAQQAGPVHQRLHLRCMDWRFPA